MATLDAAIIEAGIAIAGLLVAVAIVVTEPADLQPAPLEPRFHTVWTSKQVQLFTVEELGVLPSCDALNDFLVDLYQQTFQGSEGNDRRLNVANDEWASLECRE